MLVYLFLSSSYILHSYILSSIFFFFNDPATTEIYTLSLHDALPISPLSPPADDRQAHMVDHRRPQRSEEHTSELQSLRHLVCRLLLEKKKKKQTQTKQTKQEK